MQNDLRSSYWAGRPNSKQPAAQEPQALPQDVKDKLSPYFSKERLDRIRFTTDGLPWFTKFAPVEPGAITFGDRIYFTPRKFDPATPDGLARIAHEITHSEQYAQQGFVPFIGHYVSQFGRNFLHEWDGTKAYNAIEAERAACDKQDLVFSDLSRGYGGE